MSYRRSDCYFDDGAIGLPCDEAQRAVIALTHLIGRAGPKAPALERFIWGGHAALPAQYRSQKTLYPLKCWSGVGGLRESIIRVTGAPGDSGVSYANNSSGLMNLAARALFDAGRRVVLTTNLEHGPWLQILGAEAQQQRGNNASVKVVSVDDLACSVSTVSHELTERIVSAFARANAKALFISHVSRREGTKLPLVDIIDGVRSFCPDAFVVVDQMQSIGRSPRSLTDINCDLAIACTHKHLGGLSSFSFAVYPRDATSQRIARLAQEMYVDCLDDLVQRVQDSATTSLFGMIAGQAAMEYCFRDGIHQRFERVLRLFESLVPQLPTSWRMRTPTDPALVSGILLLESMNAGLCSISGDELRSRFSEDGIVVSGFPNGHIRVCLNHYHTDADVHRLTGILRDVA